MSAALAEGWGVRVNRRPYHVWRRSDGYVAATVGPPSGGGRGDSFEELLVTWDWGEARAAIEAARDARHAAAVASWTG